MPDGVGATASLTHNIYTGTGTGPLAGADLWGKWSRPAAFSRMRLQESLVFVGTGAGPKTVTLNTTSRTVGTLNFGDSGPVYLGHTLAASGGASLILDNTLANARINEISKRKNG